MVSRRDFLKISALMGASAYFTTSRLGSFARAFAVAAIPGLSDPALQPKFKYPVPDALSPGFKYQADKKGRYKVQIREAIQPAGLEDGFGNPLLTPVWGYADQMANKKIATWPGKTFEIKNAAAGGAFLGWPPS